MPQKPSTNRSSSSDDEWVDFSFANSPQRPPKRLSMEQFGAFVEACKAFEIACGRDPVQRQIDDARHLVPFELHPDDLAESTKRS